MNGLENLSVLDILRSIPDSVVTIGSDRRGIALNGPAESLTGLCEAYAVGRPCATVIRCEIRGTDRYPFLAAYSGGETATPLRRFGREPASRPFHHRSCGGGLVLTHLRCDRILAT